MRPVSLGTLLRQSVSFLYSRYFIKSTFIKTTSPRHFFFSGFLVSSRNVIFLVSNFWWCYLNNNRESHLRLSLSSAPALNTCVSLSSLRLTSSTSSEMYLDDSTRSTFLSHPSENSLIALLHTHCFTVSWGFSWQQNCQELVLSPLNASFILDILPNQ